MISVIIPAFNASATIGKCLAALNKQTFKPKEIIVIDDGSSDGLESKVKYLKSKLKMKQLILLKQNHEGVSAARNLGAKKASGEILAFIDSDCIPRRNWLKNINNTFVSQEIGAVGGGYVRGIDCSFWQEFSSAELLFRRRKRAKLVKTLLSNNMACRKQYFWEVGGFPVKYPVCEDMFLSYQISCRYKVIWLKNNGVIHHFKKSLRVYLKHQYFFGKESTKFFLENPSILISDNHQGKELHFAIIFSSLFFINFTAVFLFLLMEKFSVGAISLGLAVIFLIAHFFSYLNFLIFLNNNFCALSIVRTYFISFVRDLIASFSFIHGLALYIKRRSI